MRISNMTMSAFVVPVVLWAGSLSLGDVAYFIGLGDLPDGELASQANAVSADGSVVVGRGTSASDYVAFRWTEGTGMVGLADLPGGESFSEAFGISADGAVVVGLSRSAASGSLYEAFRWTESEGMVGLGDLPGGAFHSTAYPTARWKAQRVVEAFATRIGVVCPAQSTRLGCHAPSRTARI